MESPAFVPDDPTNAFKPLIGPKSQCVMLRSITKKKVAKKPIRLAPFTGSYREQIT